MPHIADVSCRHMVRLVDAHRTDVCPQCSIKLPPTFASTFRLRLRTGVGSGCGEEIQSGVERREKVSMYKCTHTHI